MAHVLELLTAEKVVSGIILLVAIFFQEFIKELAHSIKVGIGFKSNISLALHRDNAIDELLRQFTRDNSCVHSAVIAKITNGGGVPKEGSPLNSGITHPTEMKADWPVSEVSPFFRGFIQRVYNEKRVMLPIEGIPIGDPTYSYLKSQKATITCVQAVMVKEKRKCRYILSVRLTCTPEEYYTNNQLRESIRKTVNNIRKSIN